MLPYLAQQSWHKIAKHRRCQQAVSAADGLLIRADARDQHVQAVCQCINLQTGCLCSTKTRTPERVDDRVCSDQG